MLRDPRRQIDRSIRKRMVMLLCQRVPMEDPEKCEGGKKRQYGAFVDAAGCCDEGRETRRAIARLSRGRPKPLGEQRPKTRLTGKRPCRVIWEL
jgi:hypothetical protein